VGETRRFAPFNPGGSIVVVVVVVVVVVIEEWCRRGLETTT
jgi:hypothetical protein